MPRRTVLTPEVICEDLKFLTGLDFEPTHVRTKLGERRAFKTAAERAYTQEEIDGLKAKGRLGTNSDITPNSLAWQQATSLMYGLISCEGLKNVVKQEDCHIEVEHLPNGAMRGAVYVMMEQR